MIPDVKTYPSKIYIAEDDTAENNENNLPSSKVKSFPYNRKINQCLPLKK